MYQPSPQFQQLEKELANPLNKQYLAQAQDRDHPAWLLARTFDIHRQRQDSISERCCIEAFEHFQSPNRGPSLPAFSQWIQAERHSRQEANHHSVPIDTGAFLWIARDFSVEHDPRPGTYAKQGISPIATILKDDPRYFPDDLSEPYANTVLIANAALFAHTLDDAQTCLLNNLQALAHDEKFENTGLVVKRDQIDGLINSFSTQFQQATQGNWTYDPKTFTLTAVTEQNSVIPIATLGNQEQDYTPQQRRIIEQNAKLILQVPAVVEQLYHTRDALDEAAKAIDRGSALQASLSLKKVAINNDPVLRAARAEELNPHTLDPLPGTPPFEKWVKSNAAIVDAAATIPRRSTSNGPSYQIAEQQSGLYNGPIAAETADSYLQHRRDDSVVAHWKGSFSQPLEVGKQYAIAYNQGKAAAKEVEHKQVQAPGRDR